MIILSLLLLFIGFLILKTLTFKPKEASYQAFELDRLDREKITNNFVELLRHKTISNADPDKVDIDAFNNFKASLDQLYPNIKKHCEKVYIEPYGILYKWQGEKSQSPIVLMAHYDVVPVEEEQWDHPPFEGRIIDDVIWARGTLDTKSTLLGIVEAAEHLLNENFIPNQDIYFAFGGDEEVSGPSAPNIVDYLKSKNIKPAMVLDEGGAVVKDVFPGVQRPAALVGTSEKGYMDLIIKGQSNGGHASAPPAKSLNLKMASAVMKVEQKMMKSHFTPPVLTMFDRLGRYSSLSYRLIFANMWLFKGLLKMVFKSQGGQMNALIRTTMAVTKMEGSKAFNVLPSESSIGVNCRILSTDHSDDCLRHIKKVINEEDLELEVIEVREASPITNTDSEAYKKLETLIHGVFPDVIVSPYLMTGGTDSRHFSEICDHVFRFAPYRLDAEDLALIHSNNERIKIDSLMETVQFYIQLMRKL